MQILCMLTVIISGDGFKFSQDTSYLYRNVNASIKWRSVVSDKLNLLLSAGYDQYYYKTEEKGIL